MTMYPLITAEQYAADRARHERLRAIADRTLSKSDRTFLHMAANSLDFQDAQNERLTAKLMKIAEWEKYT